MKLVKNPPGAKQYDPITYPTNPPQTSPITIPYEICRYTDVELDFEPVSKINTPKGPNNSVINTH